MKYLCVLLPIASGINPCPSDDCWTFDSGTDTCTLKTSDVSCTYSITCDSNNMDVIMPHGMFGTTSASTFDTAGTGCDPVHQSGNFWQYTKSLGTCGQTLSRVASTGTAGAKIKFTRVFKISGNTDPGLSVTDTSSNSIKIYTSTSTNTVQVTFSCVFDATATATTSQVTIKPHVAVAGTAVEYEANWGDSLTLEYMDATFTTALSGTDVFIGATLYVRSSWSIANGGGIASLKYYIDNCSVRDVAVGSSVKVSIVSDTCYASTVNARMLGPSFGECSATNVCSKIVAQNSYFKYVSFSFDTSGNDVQELECDVNFCLDDGTGNTDCDSNIITPTAGTCPTTGGFGYSVFGA